MAPHTEAAKFLSSDRKGCPLPGGASIDVDQKIFGKLPPMPGPAAQVDLLGTAGTAL